MRPPKEPEGAQADGTEIHPHVLRELVDDVGFQSQGNAAMFPLMGRQDEQSHLCAGQHHGADSWTLLRHLENQAMMGDSQHRAVLNGSAQHPGAAQSLIPQKLLF